VIQLSPPTIEGNEWKYLKTCLDQSDIASGDFIPELEKSVNEYSNSEWGASVSSGTAGLHLALLVKDISEGDLVILPNLTFVAPANAVRYTGADVILIDVDQDSWQMDIDLVEEYLVNQTCFQNNRCIDRSSGKTVKAILPVHILGGMCDMPRLMKLAEDYNIIVIEDASEALGSKFNHQHAGTFGDLGVLSFNGNKIITSGGGGHVFAKDRSDIEKLRYLANQAKTNHTGYNHDRIGYNYRLPNILAALGLAQFEKLDEFIQRRRAIHSRYQDEFRSEKSIKFVEDSFVVFSNCWLTTIRSDKSEDIRDKLADKNIETRPLWDPINSLPMYKRNIYVNH